MVRRLPNGNLLVPQRAEAADGTIGDAWFEIAKDHPDYARNNAWLERMEKAYTKAPRKKKGKQNA